MNTDTQLVQQSLEQATTPATREPGELTGETVELRDSWLALSRLLAAADGDFDGQAFLAQWPQAAARPPRWQDRVWALAAALLLAVTASWAGQRHGGGVDKSPGSDLAAAANSHVSAPDPSAAEGAAAREYNWDDSFDEQLTQVDEAIARLRSPWRDDDSSLLVLNEQLQQIGQELDGGL